MITQLIDRGLQLAADGTPVVDVLLIDLDDVEAGHPQPELLMTSVAIGVARQALSPAARAIASKLACTLVPAGLEESPFEVGVANPASAAATLAESVRRAPRAAVALVNLLRVTSNASVAEGLAAESAVYSMLLAGAEFGCWLATRPSPRQCPGDPEPPVLVRRSQDVVDVVLNRPHRRNAFDRAMRDGLVEAFDLVLSDPRIGEVVLRGSGAAFCSGGDLTEFGRSADVSTAHLIRLDRSVAARVDRCNERVVARLHGACIGAGIEIPSFAGRIVARPDTFFQLPELAMGLVPGAGGTVGITHRIGRWRTAFLALSGMRLDVGTALEWGLVDAVDDS